MTLWLSGAFALLALAAGVQSGANEAQIRLKEGSARETVGLNCVLCHSLDYIPMNASAMTPERWKATVRKMIDRMGAPISEADALTIQQYLAENYVQADKP